jgi:hypothetical protein
VAHHHQDISLSLMQSVCPYRLKHRHGRCPAPVEWTDAYLMRNVPVVRPRGALSSTVARVQPGFHPGYACSVVAGPAFPIGRRCAEFCSCCAPALRGRMCRSSYAVALASTVGGGCGIGSAQQAWPGCNAGFTRGAPANRHPGRLLSGGR